MNEQKKAPYGLCVQCRYIYDTKEDLAKWKACPKCGNTMIAMDGSQDIVLDIHIARMRPLFALAKQQAQALMFQSPLYRPAMATVKGIQDRLEGQFKLRRGPMVVNWGELTILGWWAGEALLIPTTWTKEKLMGEAKKVADVLTEIERKFPDKPALSKITTLMRDQVERFFQEGPGRKNEDPHLPPGEKGKAMTMEDVMQFPELPHGPGDHAAPDSMIVHKNDALKMVGRQKPRLLDAQGQAVPPAAPGIEFFARKPAESQDLQPGQWALTGVDDIPMLRCPSCHYYLALDDHTIEEDGTVSPGLICPGPSENVACAFKADARLLGWRQEVNS